MTGGRGSCVREGRLLSRRLFPIGGAAGRVGSLSGGQADEDICHDVGWASFDICPIGLIGLIFASAQTPHEPCFPAVLVPQGQLSHSQKISVIFQKFLQARARYVHQFDLGFLGSSGGFAPFQNILLPRPRALHHLVNSPVSPIEKTFAKPHGGVVDNPRFLERKQVFVTAVRRDKVLGHGVDSL